MVFKTKKFPKNLFILLVIQGLFNPIIYSYYSIQVYLATAIILFSFVIILFKSLFANQFEKLFEPILFKSALTFIFLFLSSTLVMGISEYSFGNFTRLAMLFVTLTYMLFYKEYIYQIINLDFYIQMAFATYLSLKLLDQGFTISNRISPVGQGSANAYGAILGIICLLRLSIFKQYEKKENIFPFIFGIPITIFTIVGTFSRGALIGFLLGLLIVFSRLFTIKASLLSLNYFVIALLVIYQLYDFSKSFLSSRYSATNILDSSGREVIYHNAFLAFQNNPLLGSGFGSKFNPFTSGEASTHNVFIQILGETGLLGIFISLFFVILFLKKYRPKISIPSIICLLIVSITDNHFLAVQFHLTFSIVYLLAISEKEIYSRSLI